TTGGGTIKGPVTVPSVGSVGPGSWYGFSGPGSVAGGPAVTHELDVVLPAGTTKHFTAYLPSSPGTWTAEVVGPSGSLLTAAQRRALDDYVAQGGSILATGGDAWRKTQAGLPADLVAMAASGVQSVPGLPGLASALGKPTVVGSVDVTTGTRRSGVTALG